MEKDVFENTNVDMDKLSIFYEDNNFVWIVMWLMLMAIPTSEHTENEEDKNV